MLNIPSIQEQRATKVAELRAIASKEAAGTTPTDEERSRFNEIEVELRGLDEKLRRAQVLAEFERRMDGEPVTSGENKLDVKMRTFSLRKAILSQVPGHSEDTSRERELSAEIARRSGRTYSKVSRFPTACFASRSRSAC
jgi:hypothetical protein